MRGGWGLVLLIFSGCDGFRVDTAASGGQAASLTLAYGKSCARMSDGGVRCWGNRPSSLLRTAPEGVDAPFDTRPRAIPGIGGAFGLATNLVHDCALAADHTVTCWSEGEAQAMWSDATGSVGIASSPLDFLFLGADHALRAAGYLSPLKPVNGGTDVADVANNWSSSCVRRTDGSVACGGANDQGQLGDGSKTDSPTFVAVSLNERAIELAVGDRFACVLTESSSVWCWGANDRGQLGDGTKVAHSVPRLASAQGWASHVVAGRAHVCTTDLNAVVRCWGANEHGQLGDGTHIDRVEAMPVAGVQAPSIAAAWLGDHNCAIGVDGKVVCWGANDRGQLGDGTTDDRSQATPVAF